MTEYIKTKTDNTCYGCRACEQICPKQAISIQPNKEGFLYPVLEENKCIECGLCTKVCPHDNLQESTDKPLHVYAGQYRESEALMESSSGGVFSAVADYVLGQGGYVVGCLFDENYVAIHAVTNKKVVVAKMRGSKYVQSDTRNTYSQVSTLLEENNTVLFTGTPCQVDGLRKYLRKEYANLIMIDLICHGVPSPKMLSDYLGTIRAKGGTITELTFRNKGRNGWCSQGSIGYQNRVRTISPFNNSYYYYYLQNSISRMCCYECKYSSTTRVGDISIGDFWGVQDAIPQLDKKNGISAILVNTEKGLKTLTAISDRTLLHETQLEVVTKYNGNLREPCKMPPKRTEIYERIEKEGYEAVAKKECHYQYVKPFIRKHFPKGLRKVIKKILDR